MMTQMMNNNNNNNGHNNNNPPPPPPPPPHVDMLTGFLRLRPSTFTSSSKPIVADDWLRSVNKNLVTIGCTEVEKVRFAAHLLEGPASSWWENYQITHPIEEVNWDMFQEAFRTAHISSGVMSLKKREFRNNNNNNNNGVPPGMQQMQQMMEDQMQAQAQFFQMMTNNNNNNGHNNNNPPPPPPPHVDMLTRFLRL
jgi:hypothetical protein